MSNRETVDPRSRILFPTIVLLAALVTASASLAAAPAIHNSRFVYSTEEKLGFDLEAYLRDTAPHLLPEAEFISHWSAYYTVSPRIVLALMELQTRQIRGADPGSSSRPFGALSAGSTLRQQVEDVLFRLSSLFYDSPADADGLRVASAAREALHRLLGSEEAVAKLRSSYGSLFPAERPLDERAENLATDKAVPPPGLLQLPYPVGESWYFGGAHTYTGSDPGPKSSLDFTRDLEDWGDNTSNTWVAAAHGGTVVVFSSCFVEVLGPNGWSTSYYHLDNVVVADGQTVGWDQRLANYADNLPQAICNGGHSSGPHVHFSLRRNGEYVHLQDVQLSRYRVHPGRFSYDRDCNFFWLERGGVRHCAWLEPLLNDGGTGVVVRPVAPADLTARGLSTTEIRLEWSDRSNNESGFQIERRSAGGGGFQRIATAGANATHWVDADLASGTTYVYRLRAVNSAGASAYSAEARATTFIEDPEPCVAADDRLCLAGERFTVEVDWRDHNGNTGRGRTVPFGSADSGLLWFFAADNWEMLIKVLDGCGFNDRFWVFAAATTDVEYTLTVIDSLTGHVATYFNPLGNASAAITDIEALATCDAAGTAIGRRPVKSLLPRSASAGSDKLASCTAGPTNLCLAGGRFRVEVEWQDFDGNTGSGRVVPFGSADSGLFWFFAEDNWEMLVKVLDACSFNDHYWVFSAATTNVGYTLRVTDTVGQEVREWVNPLGTAAPAITATTAFATCE